LTVKAGGCAVKPPKMSGSTALPRFFARWGSTSTIDVGGCDGSTIAAFRSPISPIEIEYETRAGDVQVENLTMSLIREASVHMYKRRARVSNPINIITRRR
jgi:hypothetical protein